MSASRPDGRMHHARQVPFDEPRVPSGDGHFRRKRQIVTNKHRTPHRDRRRKRLVVRVPQANHQAVVVVRLAIGDFQQTEVAQSIVPQVRGPG